MENSQLFDWASESRYLIQFSCVSSKLPIQQFLFYRIKNSHQLRESLRKKVQTEFYEPIHQK